MSPAAHAERIYDLADDLAAVDRNTNRVWERSSAEVRSEIEAICALAIGDAYLAVHRLKALADRLSAEPTPSYAEAVE